MKKLIATIILAVFAPIAAANDTCVLLADLSRIITEARDDGESLIVIKADIKDTQLNDEMKQIVMSMAEHIYYDTDLQTMTPRQIATFTYKACNGE